MFRYMHDNLDTGKPLGEAQRSPCLPGITELGKERACYNNSNCQSTCINWKCAELDWKKCGWEEETADYILCDCIEVVNLI